MPFRALRQRAQLIQRLIRVRHQLERTLEFRDEVSRIILNALALKGPMNISGLTREVATERGSASRVRARGKRCWTSSRKG